LIKDLLWNDWDIKSTRFLTMGAMRNRLTDKYEDKLISINHPFCGIFESNHELIK